MESKIEKLADSRIKISIVVSKEEFQKYYDQSLAKYAENIKIDGFRKGKAPIALAEKQIGKEVVTADALDEAVPDLYYKAVIEHNVQPVERADMKISSFDENELKFEAEVDVLPKVEVKDWRAIKVKKPAEKEIEDADVDRVIDQMRKERAKLLEVDRPIKNGDFASITYTGSVDKVEREDMASKNHPIVVGEGGLIPGFEDELIGMKVAEEKEFDITFPKDYHQKDLAKRKAKFKVKIEAMKEIEMPVLDDDFAKNFGLKSKDELMKKVREQLITVSKEETKRGYEEQVLQELAKRTKTALPKSLIEKELDRFVENIKARFSLDDKTLPIYFEKQHKTMEKYREEMAEPAKRNVTISLAISEVMNDLNIKPESKDCIQKTIDELVASAER